MGTCLSAPLPRRVFYTRRKGSRKETPPTSDDSDNKKLAGEVNDIELNELPASVNSNCLPDDVHTDDVHSKPPPNGVHRKHLPDEEDNERVPDDAPNKHLPSDVHDNHLPDRVHDKTKRRALLVGITYCSPSNTWSQLDGPHADVDQYRDLLINTYGYRPEDIVVLKDLPGFPRQFMPTHVNLIRELKALVSGAEPGDKFTFFYSGHSDQQEAEVDTEEEDGMDEMIITSDEKTIIDDELKIILVNPLPVGCTLLAILDTCHSGTLLDLPHYHCNSIYVPWQSKGERRTNTMQNINVRRQATDFSHPGIVLPPSTFETAINTIEGQSPTAKLHIDTQLGQGGQREMSLYSPRGRPRARREQKLFGSPTRCSSPEARFACDGWCKYSEESHPNVLSLSACSDLQRAWEGPKGSLTTVLCNYLKKCSRPSYGSLMAHINFELHDNALALHEYTRHERKKASGFDGELDNFQEPELSSLVRLNMDDILLL